MERNAAVSWVRVNGTKHAVAGKTDWQKGEEGADAGWQIREQVVKRDE